MKFFKNGVGLTMNTIHLKKKNLTCFLKTYQV